MADLQSGLFDSSIEEQFERFHTLHPEVMTLFVKYAYQIKRKGFKAYSSKAIWERMRWELDMQMADEAGFKLNNNFTSRYARRAAELYPDLKDFFRTRELRAA